MSNKAMLRGADIVAMTLERMGVDRIFSVSGNHVMPLYDALIDTRIGLIHARHEAACVHMADAYSRVTGQIGVALVTGGPGHTNAIAALYTALGSEAPMLLLSGHASRAELGRGAFQELRQADMAKPVTKASWTLDAARSAGHELARAAGMARSGRPGPVHVSLPADVLDDEVDPHSGLWPEPEDALAVPILLPARDAAFIVEQVHAAARPLVLCGPSLSGTDGKAWMSRIEEALGVPAFAMDSPRGINDPRLGAFAEILAQADLIVLIGKPLDFTLRFGDAPAVQATCAFIVVDPDAARLALVSAQKGERVRLAALADAHQAVDAIIDAARASAQRDAKPWLQEARDAAAFRPADWKHRTPAPAGPVHPLDVCAVLQNFFREHPEATLVCDGGEIGQWPQSMVDAPRRLINGVAGEIGPSLPYALAVKCARPQHPVVAIMGDGTFRLSHGGARHGRAPRFCRSSWSSATMRAGTPSIGSRSALTASSAPGTATFSPHATTASPKASARTPNSSPRQASSRPRCSARSHRASPPASMS